MFRNSAASGQAFIRAVTINLKDFSAYCSFNNRTAYERLPFGAGLFDEPQYLDDFGWRPGVSRHLSPEKRVSEGTPPPPPL